MREERRNRAQENAQKASVKILLPMIVFDLHFAGSFFGARHYQSGAGSGM